MSLIGFCVIMFMQGFLSKMMNEFVVNPLYRFVGLEALFFVAYLLWQNRIIKMSCRFVKVMGGGRLLPRLSGLGCKCIRFAGKIQTPLSQGL